MSFSYSFHLSNKGNALTTVSKIGGASKHNLRLYKDTQNGNYDKSLIEILEGSDVSILDSVKKIYHEEFDEALLKYNEGKRPDRQITDYLEHVSNKKADVACELIIQVGDKDFWKGKSLEERKQMNDIFKSQIEELKRILPDFKIASAVAHYDESSPHLHVVGVPVHEGYKKGLEKQVSKRNVFTQESLKMLQDKMREHVQEQMKDKDIFKDMELKEKEKGRNKDIPKHALDDFYKLEKEIELKGYVAYLRITSDKDFYYMMASSDGINFTQLAKMEYRFLSTETIGGFTGVMLGLFAQYKEETRDSYVDVDWFEYKHP